MHHYFRQPCTRRRRGPRMTMALAFVVAAALLLNTVQAHDDHQTLPLPTLIHKTIECSSTLLDGGWSSPITPHFDLHWRFNNAGDNTASDWQTSNNLTAVVQYHMANAAWVGLGFSPKDGSMIHSKAVIGSSLEKNGVALYDLREKDASGFVPIAGAKLQGEFLPKQANTTTDLIFHLELQPEIVGHSLDGLYTLVVAGGDNLEDGETIDALTYHRHRASFRINLRTCGQPQEKDLPAPAPAPAPLPSNTQQQASTVTATEGSPYNHKAAFLAHGVFAVLALAIFLPLSVSASIFRATLPTHWIYIHVLGNSAAFLLTMLSMATAFVAVVLRDSGSIQSSHMTHSHHWMGLVLFLLLFFQVMYGLNRPPVEATVDATRYQRSNSIVRFAQEDKKKAMTKRERWFWIHRILAVVVAIVTLFQLSSGIVLYGREYSGKKWASLILLWVWLALLCVYFGVMHIYNSSILAMQQRSSAHKFNLAPQRDEDITDEAASTALMDADDSSVSTSGSVSINVI